MSTRLIGLWHDLANEIEQIATIYLYAAMMLGVISRARGENERAKKYFEDALSLAEPINLSRVMNVANREIEKLSGEDRPG